VGLLISRREESLLSQRSVSSSLSLGMLKGLRTLWLLRELADDDAAPLQRLESDVPLLLWTFILTSGTRSLPSAPFGTRERCLGEGSGSECVEAADEATGEVAEPPPA
jgi:hypothetical protein